MLEYSFRKSSFESNRKGIRLVRIRKLQLTASISQNAVKGNQWVKTEDSKTTIKITTFLNRRVADRHRRLPAHQY